jgi:hypothetical protein
MSKSDWRTRLGWGVIGWTGGLASIALFAGCPQSPDWPPFVRSGSAGGSLVSGSASATDAAVVDSGTEDAGDGGEGVTIACSVAASFECAMLTDVVSDDENAMSTACEGTTGQGGLGGTSNIGLCPTSLSAGALLGCCEFPGGGQSWGQPNYQCYYSGFTGTPSTVCSGAGGTFSTGLP